MEPSDYQPFDPQVHEYVDGRMSADGERDFVRKLERNSELKKQVESLQKALGLLGAMPVEQPKEGFDQRVIGRVKEEELAERARKQIVSARVPMWQHVVQVGLGAAAAALVFVIVGVPGYFQSETDPTAVINQSGGEAARVVATEDDLLPTLADHRARFESMRRSVSCTRLDDPHAQRELIMLELQYSDLERRNAWLQGQVTDLPGNCRAEYKRYIAALDEALSVIQKEINTSLQESRPIDVEVVVRVLDRVPELKGKVESVQFTNHSGELVPDDKRIIDGSFDDVDLYALVRRADYRHDHAAVIDAVQVYRTHMKSGKFRHHANAAAVAAYLRLNRDREAARRFADDFGDYDEDLTSEQKNIVQGLLTEGEWNRLVEARKTLLSE